MSVTQQHATRSRRLARRIRPGSTGVARAVTAALGVVLASVVMTGAGTAQAHAAPAAAAECSDWTQIPGIADPNHGYLGDRHARLWIETQKCSNPGQADTWFARATYIVFSPDTLALPRPGGLQQEGLRFRLYDLTENDGCSGCVTGWASPLIQESVPGSSYVGDPMALRPGHEYRADVRLTYVNPPNPRWDQHAAVRMTAPQ